MTLQCMFIIITRRANAKCPVVLVAAVDSTTFTTPTTLYSTIKIPKHSFNVLRNLAEKHTVHSLSMKYIQKFYLENPAELNYV